MQAVLNCENLEATKKSFNEWINKLWYIPTKEYFSAIERNVFKTKKEMERL